MNGRRRVLACALAAMAAGASARPAARRNFVLAYWGTWFAVGRPPDVAKMRVAWLEEALAKQGFVVGDNTRVVYAFTSWDTRHEIAAEARRLVDARPDVAWPRLDLNRPKREAIRALARDLPIVMDYWDETLAAQTVGNLQRPSGNTTGVATNYALLTQKRCELVRQLLPKARRVGVVADLSTVPAYAVDIVEKGARAAGLEILLADVAQYGCSEAPTSKEGGAALDRALDDLMARRPDAYMAVGGFACAPLRVEQLESRELRHRIPYIHDGGSTGSVVGLGWNYVDHRTRAVSVVAKLFRGARPADIPIEVTSRYRLTVNPRRAREIGIEIPGEILIRADEILS